MHICIYTHIYDAPVIRMILAHFGRQLSSCTSQLTTKSVSLHYHSLPTPVASLPTHFYHANNTNNNKKEQ